MNLLQKLLEIDTVDSRNGEKVVALIREEVGAEEFVVECDGVVNAVFKKGRGAFGLCGHYDVVPAGGWDNAFKPRREGDLIYARGACDMKGGLAAAVEAFKELDDALLIVVGDEEKGGYKGAFPVVNFLKKRSLLPKAVVFTEPVSGCGKKIKVGARGVMEIEGWIESKGGHASRPSSAPNPILLYKALLEEVESSFSNAPNSNLPPTTVTPTIVETPNLARNVIPSLLRFTFDCRFNEVWDAEKVKRIFKKVLGRLKGARAEFSIVCDYYLNNDKRLEAALQNAFEDVHGEKALLTCEGGSSDAVFFAPYCGVAEIGPSIRNMHAKDECVSLSELKALKEVLVRAYERYV